MTPYQLLQDARKDGVELTIKAGVLNILANAKEEILARKVATGRIEIELQRQGETILLRVSDNAGGIAPEILPKIFDPYFTTKDKGSGIGLYMAKTIIEHNMNGSISAANLGDGACFTLTVPVQGAAVTTAAGSSLLWDSARSTAMFNEIAQGDTSNLDRFKK